MSKSTFWPSFIEATGQSTTMESLPSGAAVESILLGTLT